MDTKRGRPRDTTPKRPRFVFLAEHMDDKGIGDEALANRLGVARETVTRWRTYQERIDLPKLHDIAKALGMRPERLWQHPNQISLDDLAADAPEDVRQQAAEIVSLLVKRRQP